MALPLIDTNVLLRHLRQDDPDHSPRATAYLQRIEDGQFSARISEFVIFEAIFTLERAYKVPKAVIRTELLPLIELPGIVLPGKRRLRRVFELYVRFNVSFVAAYQAVMVESFNLQEIVSFDRDFDRLPGLKRVEP